MVNLRKDLQGRISDAKGLLQRHTTRARQILRKLLVEPLTYEVVEEDDRQSFRITGEGSYLGLLNGVASHLWCPQGDFL